MFTPGLAPLLDLPAPDIGAWPGLAPLFDLFAMPGDAVAAEVDRKGEGAFADPAIDRGGREAIFRFKIAHAKELKGIVNGLRFLHAEPSWRRKCLPRVRFRSQGHRGKVTRKR